MKTSNETGLEKVLEIQQGNIFIFHDDCGRKLKILEILHEVDSKDGDLDVDLGNTNLGSDPKSDGD